MAHEETFTLITICWNAAKTLRRTVDSVLAQSRLPQEYLFVDGGSTDGTLELLETCRPLLETRGVKMQILHQHCPPEAAGIPDAWNQGLAAATGGVIGLLNADDWYEPETLATVMDAFRSQPDCEAVVCPVAFRTAEGTLLYTLPPRPLTQLAWRMTLPHPGCFFTRGLYDRVGLYDTRYRISADYDFAWRCRKANVRFHFLPKALVNMQAGGLADTGRARARRETLAIARKYAPWWDLRPQLAWLFRTILGK